MLVAGLLLDAAALDASTFLMNRRAKKGREKDHMVNIYGAHEQDSKLSSCTKMKERERYPKETIFGWFWLD